MPGASSWLRNVEILSSTKFLGCTSLRTSPGLTTLHYWLRRLKEASTPPAIMCFFYQGTTGVPSLAALLCVMEAALPPVGRCCKTSSVLLRPPLQVVSKTASPAEPSATLVTSPKPQCPAVRSQSFQARSSASEQLHQPGCQDAVLCPPLPPHTLLFTSAVVADKRL